MKMMRMERVVVMARLVTAIETVSLERKMTIRNCLRVTVPTLVESHRQRRQLLQLFQNRHHPQN